MAAHTWSPPDQARAATTTFIGAHPDAGSARHLHSSEVRGAQSHGSPARARRATSTCSCPEASARSFQAALMRSGYTEVGQAESTRQLPAPQDPNGALIEVHVPARQPAPVTLDTQIAGWIDARIADGSLPKPSAQTVFALFSLKALWAQTAGCSSDLRR